MHAKLALDQLSYVFSSKLFHYKHTFTVEKKIIDFMMTFSFVYIMYFVHIHPPFLALCFPAPPVLAAFLLL